MKRTPLTRRTPIRKRNPKRGGHRFPKLVNEAFREYVRGLECCVWTSRSKVCFCLCWYVDGKSHPDHYRTRGAAGADEGNLTPLCATHHDERHLIGVRSFQRKYGLDLKAIAADIWSRYPGEPKAGEP